MGKPTDDRQACLPQAVEDDESAEYVLNSVGFDGVNANHLFLRPRDSTCGEQGSFANCRGVPDDSGTVQTFGDVMART